MSVDFWRDFIYADCTWLGGRIKGIQFSLFKGGPWMAWVHTFTNGIYWTLIWRGGQAKKNEMIKCATFLIEQILTQKCKWMSWKVTEMWKRTLGKTEGGGGERCERMQHKNQCRLTERGKQVSFHHLASDKTCFCQSAEQATSFCYWLTSSPALKRTHPVLQTGLKLSMLLSSHEERSIAWPRF